MGYFGPEVMLSTLGKQGIGPDLVAATAAVTISSSAFSANICVFVPIFIDYPGLMTKLWIENSASNSGNVDIGLYNSSGGLPTTRIISAGSTANAGASQLQEFDITDTYLQGQTLYFVGFGVDNITATFYRLNAGVNICRALGMVQQSTYPLPSSVTPANLAAGSVPSCGIAFRALVA